MDLNFQHLDSLVWLWLVAGIGLLAWWGVLARRRAIRRFAEAPMLARLAPRLSMFRISIRSVLAVTGLFFLVLALADPRWGVRYVEVNRRGMDVMFVVDVSRSMLARDASPSRLDRARLFIEGAVDSMAGDRVGLVGVGLDRRREEHRDAALGGVRVHRRAARAARALARRRRAAQQDRLRWRLGGGSCTPPSR